MNTNNTNNTNLKIPIAIPAIPSLAITPTIATPVAFIEDRQ